MLERRVLLLAAALVGLFLVAPTSASALCNGLAATVGGATSGNDTLTGTSGNDVIEGLGGNDTVNGGGGSDTICGGDGDDTIDGGSGSDHMEGGSTGETAGDTVTFVSVAVQLVADLQAQTATNTAGDSDAILEFENLTGSDSFDILRGDDEPNLITGLDKADGFQGRGGDDTFIDQVFPVDQGSALYPDATGPITGTVGDGVHTVSGPGVGTDTLNNVRGIEGSPFADQLTGDSSTNLNALHGMGGDDVLVPLGGNDSVGGEEGTDQISYVGEGAVTVNLATFTGTTATGTDSITGVENVTGSPENDTITGDSNNNVLDGLEGGDTLTGGDGTDTASFATVGSAVVANLASGTATGQGADTLATLESLTGSSQGDRLTGNAASNVLNGGAGGADTARFDGVATAVVASLATGTATGQGTDTLTNVDNLFGSSEADTLTGNDAANTLDGGDSADNLEGAGGDDIISDPSGGTSDLDELIYFNSPGPGGVIADLSTGTVDGTAAGAGTDTVSGVQGVIGSNFGDQLIGDGTGNELSARGGGDLLIPSGGADFAIGGVGADTISYAAETGPIVSSDFTSGDPGNVTTPGGNDTVFGIETVIGSTAADDITGGTGEEQIDGFGGDDELDGAGGIDTATFGTMAQTVDANLATGVATGQGSDTLTNMENLTGSSQDDFLTGDANDNAFNGGSGGIDTVRFSAVAQAVTANLATGAATGQGSDTLANIDNLTGSSQGDTLIGDANPNFLSGLDGADNIMGGLGADGLFLGAGLDQITADDGVVDSIDCEGGGPDSGSVDGPAPAETYTDCDSDGDALVDFLDSCPTTAGSGSDGCVPPVVTPPVQTTPTTPATPPTAKKKCKKKKKRTASVAKKKCKKKKR